MSIARLAGLRPLIRLFQAAHASTTSPIDRVRQSNFDLLHESLESNGNPTRVWANYTNLLSFLGSEPLPLDIHQQVLRKCTPASTTLRASAARRIFAGNVPQTPHVYEGRFIAVIRNIRSAGFVPTLDDYNFVLEQFAAVGHHFGVMHVYRELTSLGVVPRTKTFGLCLQAIAHRLTLPVAPKDKDERVAATRRMLSDLITAMKTYHIPFTSVNLDLSMRILRETTDMKGFELLMKWGYGIDLGNPDCPPIEYLEGNEPPAPPQPFSTAALNMTIDTLGRLNDVSRMIQTFEVLTAPLPPRVAAYDEEEDDELGFRSESSFPFPPPSAEPNTTTYNILIRHLSRAGHAVLARHYLIQAMHLERETVHSLRYNVTLCEPQQVPSPHFAVNRGTLLSVFGESNRDKNAGLMRWLHSKFPRILMKKRNDLEFFVQIREKRRRDGIWPYDGSSTDTATEPRASQTTLFSPKHWTAPKHVGQVFELDIESEESPVPFPSSKYFDLDLHIRLLERDIFEIAQLYDHVEKMLVRTTHRIKQRLGRRVSGGRDIYIATEIDDERDRVRISSERWQNIANFRSTEVLPDGYEALQVSSKTNHSETKTGDQAE
ncbi:hypothetical protein C8F01DRAFT_591605 [Mycena amicta]|nr:hypothetical protein C8F01DRAFT_591605 [Mycena amicta]